MRTALTVAGSDSVGGAGIQTDIKAMASVGVHAVTVITAVTAQNTCKVSRIFPMPADMVQAQLDAVLSDCNIRAVKTGMLYSAEIVNVVTDALEDRQVSLIVDPVMVATVGDSLCDATYVRALREKLLPICELVTPNLYEAEVLSNMKIRSENDVSYACEVMGKEGTSVLLKGGHMDTREVIDYLYLSSEIMRIRNPRLATAGHGSGCALSSFITANMANGLDLVNAVLESRKLEQQAIATQYRIGKGAPVVNTRLSTAENKDTVVFDLLDKLDTAVSQILRLLPTELVPRNGLNMAYAMPEAAGPEQIAAVDKRIKVHNGTLVRGGQVRFGTAEHMSYVLLEAMHTNPEVRCMMNIASSIEMVDDLRDAGYTVAKLERKEGLGIAAMTRAAIDSCPKFPDVIADVGSRRSDKTINIFGTDPQDVLKKLNTVL
ncbi:MAG: bifunctional hydroxymethylpyrimidine kinase/phosphomethylpyrimidine kinase [Candidatus Methanomethylophilus sp.]|nr:bifunctional hydroxymethylpyrimidine kinase/phosphomethylpyrimidine kinase [Methanomethylophilus sp.]